MKKKEYMKPAMLTICVQHHSIICISPTGIQPKNSDDDDNPVFDGSNKGAIWDAN